MAVNAYSLARTAILEMRTPQDPVAPRLVHYGTLEGIEVEPASDHRLVIRGRTAAGLAVAAVLVPALVLHGLARKGPLAPPPGDPPSLDPPQSQVAVSIVDGLARRITGKLHAIEEVQRVERDVAPIVDQASRQPLAQRVLAEMARDTGISPEEARIRWVKLQVADLLLESGGDPDSLSGSDAAGVAQWLPGTAQGVGLSVNLQESHALTQQIDNVKHAIGWMKYLQLPDANHSLPGAPHFTRAQAVDYLPVLEQKLSVMESRRRKIDERYDPEKSIFAQTRYLLALYRRFPSADWQFQAYHGGEGGVEHTLRLYLGTDWPGSTAEAIRHGSRGRLLTYEDVYFSTTPTLHPAAFYYLYGRSDNHRYYWWTLRASEQVLGVYERDPAALQDEWANSPPGRPMEVSWYPDAASLATNTLADISDELRSGQLVRVTPTRNYMPYRDPLYPSQSPWIPSLRPESRGLLELVASLYVRCGGPAPLAVGDTTLPARYLDWRRLQTPPPPHQGPPLAPDILALAAPHGGPPPGFDYHTTGLAFDLQRPESREQREILEYALGYYRDRGVLWWSDEGSRQDRHYHVVPAPPFATTLARIGGESPPDAAHH